MDLAYIPKYFRKCRDSYDVQDENKENNFQLSKEQCIKEKGTCLKYRYIAICSGFMGEFLLFFHRITLSLGIVAMVSHSAVVNESHFPTAKSCMNLIENNSSKQINESMIGEFQWSPELQGYILGSSFICYIIALPFIAKLAEIYGAKNILFCCILSSSLFTFLSPFAARWSVYAFIVVQTLRGICQGGIMPSETMLISNWFPKQERGFSFSLMFCGSSVGSVVGSYLTGVLCESAIFGGWPLAFFVNGSVGFIAAIMIYFFLYDNPSVHPRISLAELDYIVRNQENVLTEKRPKTPWKSLFTSVPLYALSYAVFGQMWACAQFLTVNPTFLKTILHYSIEQDGLFNALPFLLQIVTSQIAGVLSTILNKKNCISIDKSRKFWTLLSCIGYSACLLGIYFAGCNRTLTAILSVAALSFVGFSFAGCWVVFGDMSPTFAGSVTAIACFLSSFAHFLLPVTVGYLTNDSQTIEQWQKIFIICITVVLSSGLIFCVFGSAEVQPWNYVVEDKSEQDKQKTDEQYYK